MYASRSVPVLNTPAPNAAYVDDSSSQNESLQRKADMANGAVQRVVQRWPGDDDSSEYDEMHQDGYVKLGDDEYDEMRQDGYEKLSDDEYDEMRQLETIPLLGNYPRDFPIDEFVYKNTINDDLKFKEGRILFTEYKANLISSGFNGCMMMAFKFNQSYTCDMLAGGKKRVHPAEIYIAHVYKDGSGDLDAALVNAEREGLIEIDALFKPYDDRDGKNIEEEIKKSNLNDSEQALFFSAMPSFTGAMKKNGNEYCAEVYVPDVSFGTTNNGIRTEKNVNVYDVVKKLYPDKERADEQKKIKTLNHQQLKEKTLATKAMVYATVISKKNVDDENFKYAFYKLEEIAKSNSDSLIEALNLTRNEMCKKNIIRVLRIYTDKTLDEIKCLIADDGTKRIVDDLWKSESPSASVGAWL